ncbi:YibE/F family protein [Halobacillus salinarum]|uniref:YibE/F family protein n=1 Tax=Halobacillus salinarum TaxID=2932257 RepID=A0ABY4EPW0_9BACI|nr:YibE/F family protein [Halobacillus salinarum]UOQ46410.1 YibE/F family protein [Halobacillus salinarum]
MTYKQLIIYTLIGLFIAGSVLFVNHNSSFYKRTVAQVVDTKVEDSNQVKDVHDNKDQVFKQSITAEIKNGKEKGKEVHLTNKYSSSGAYDQEYRVGNELFISIDNKSKEKGQLTGSITDVKRDKYVLLVGWIFILTLLIVGKKRGFFSMISLAVNVSLISIALDVYVNHSDTSLLWICSILVVLFTIISLLLLNGFNEMTYAAIAATLLGILLSLSITYGTIKLTDGSGLRYEEMQFLTRPYEVVFMAGLFIGSLGAVMDVAITIASSIFGLYEKNRNVSIKALRKSGMDIGKDVMGTLTNILFFVYVSGSIPSMILYLKNASALGFTLSMNLSLEFARALAGGIGIVLTIPIAVYTSVLFVNRKRNRL